MDNHFYVVVETVAGNLSARMRQLNGGYTQWHNQAHGRVGHVFQGRFEAILVQREAYLLELAHYVVLNPVRGGICEMPEQWPWSSYLAMVGQAPRPNWLLAQCGSQYNRAVATYIEHVRAGVGLPSVRDALQDQPYLGYLGDAVFTDKARQTVSNRLLNDSEIPRLQRKRVANTP